MRYINSLVTFWHWHWHFLCAFFTSGK